MRSRIAAVCLCWIVIFLAPGAKAQQPGASTQSWDALRQTAAGEKLLVERKGGKRVSGRAISISDTELLIERKGKTESFKREDVQKVWRVAPPSRAKQVIFGSLGAFGGLFAGLALAVPIALSDCGGSCVGEGAAMISLVVGLPVAGALAGRALAGKGKRTLIYSAP